MQNTKNLSDWLTHIESFNPNEIELGLERIDQVAKQLDVKTLAGKIVIVGGTNGKGSCVAMLEALALTHGISVAAYTSPHLIEFNERIRINGQSVTDSRLVQAFSLIEQQRENTALTFFEFTTLAALYLFKQAAPDLVILEVGLGGRLDAVNIIDPDVAVITTIDIDHIDWLGNTLSAIAAEKAGILRQDKLAIIGDEASYQLVKALKLPSSNQLTLVSKPDETQQAAINDPISNKYALLSQNIMAAMNVFQHLFADIAVDLAKSLSCVQISGRFQQLATAVPTIVDVAHNPQAARNLLAQLQIYKQCHSRVKIIAICGMMKDKAVDEVLQILSLHIDQWTFVDLDIPRAISALAFQKIYQRVLPEGKSQVSSSVASAYAEIIATKPENTLILVFGSFITVGKMLQYSSEL